VCVCQVCARVSGVCVLGGGGLAVVLDPGDGGFAEETVLVVHQVLVDTGSEEKTESQKQDVCVCVCVCVCDPLNNHQHDF